MNIFAPKGVNASEPRVSLVPDGVKKLAGLGASVTVERGIGAGIHVGDTLYEKAGAVVAEDRAAAFAAADIVLMLEQPAPEDIARLRRGAILIGFLDPLRERALIGQLAEAGVTALSVEMIPRTTIAQKMDALSSQASLAGYAAVILAASRLQRILPMMMTPAGTIPPARVFVIGAGVAGLQAIATAHRLGARVEAFDTRPVVAEQVQSLGARFVTADLGETGQTKDGYAKELKEEQLAKQRELMSRHCAQADIVITTAQVFGRTAPRIVTQEMVKGMKPGSVIVDLAVSTGGNVEGSRDGEDVAIDGVTILGVSNLPGRVAYDASLMYSNNVVNLVEHFWDKENKTLAVNFDDEIMRGCAVTHDGKVVNEMVGKRYEEEGNAG
jgi:NAD(P) transhydrogenase subunit alpha